MTVDNKDGQPHLFPRETGESLAYTTVGGGGGRRHSPPPRDRDEHADALATNLSTAAREFERAREQSEKIGVEREGDILSFDVVVNPKLKLDSLEDRRAGTELLSFRMTHEDQGVASVFVPDGQLDVYERKIEEYRAKDTPKGHPKHEPLVNSIDAIKRARLEDLWTDPIELNPPTGTAQVWWEVWTREDVGEESFRAQAKKAGLHLKDQVLSFPGRLVFVAHASADEMITSVELLDVFAEIRRARPVDHEFVAMTRREQRKWAEDLVERTEPASDDAPFVCLLDTGVDHGHLLLSQSITKPGTRSRSEPARIKPTSSLRRTTQTGGR